MLSREDRAILSPRRLRFELFNTLRRLAYSLSVFITRQRCAERARPPVRPSVRPSVCLSVTRVDQSKTVEVRIMQLSPQSSL